MDKNLQLSLKERLDEIDGQTTERAFNGFYESRLSIKWGEWEKGKVIAAVFTPLKTPLSWRELSRQTGRDQKALKRWHDLYQAYPAEKQYEPIAEKEAEEWTEKACKKQLPPPEPTRETQEEIESEIVIEQEGHGVNETIEIEQEEEQEKTEYQYTETYEVSDAMNFATMAISQLERIRDDDPKREEALIEVEQWILKNRRVKK